MSATPDMDLPAIVAAVGVVGRSGAAQFEIGWLDDSYPHRWWASAKYQGRRITGEHPSKPDIAVDRLVHKMLHGGLCVHCGDRINLTPTKGRWADGNCEWHRVDAIWQPGCGVEVDKLGKVVVEA